MFHFDPRDSAGRLQDAEEMRPRADAPPAPPFNGVPSTGPVLMPLTAPEPRRLEIAPLDVTDPKALVGMIDTLLRRSGLSKAEVARRMGVKYQSLQQYWALRRGTKRSVTLRWFARLVAATGGRLVVELPEPTARR